METYIALLRGINVSGQKKIKMADLKVLLTNAGLQELQTYIQSGNVVFNGKGKVSAFAKIISDAITSEYGFQVPVLVKTKTEMLDIMKECPFDEEKMTASYYTLLHKAPAEDYKTEVAAITYPNEEFAITDSCVYMFAAKSYGRAKGNNNFFERKLKVIATTRNYKTMMKLIEMAS